MAEPSKTLLKIRFPQSPIEHHIGKFEQFFHNVHYLLKAEDEVNRLLSCEIVSIQNQLNFYISVTEKYSNTLQHLLYSLFPEAEITQTERYEDTDKLPNHAFGFAMTLTQNELYSLRTYKLTAPHDPLSLLISTISFTPPKHGVMFQLVIDPLDEELETASSGLFYGETKRSAESVELPKFQATMRLLYFFPNDQQTIALDHIEEVQRSFHEFSAEKNRIVFTQAHDVQAFTKEFFSRKQNNVDVLTQEEVASLFHIPDPSLYLTSINWITSKHTHPPFNLPTLYTAEAQQAVFFGETNFRGQKTAFGILHQDLKQHMYIVGKAGYGKTHLLHTLAFGSIQHDKPTCVIDFHGDLSQTLFESMPPEKQEHIVYLNAAEKKFPLQLNPLINFSSALQSRTVQDLIEIIRHHSKDWSNNMDQLLRYALLALMAQPDTSLLSIIQLLKNSEQRAILISQTQDEPTVQGVIRAIEALLSYQVINQLFVQSTDKPTIAQALKNKKTIIVNLAGSKLTTTASSVLGSIILAQVLQYQLLNAKTERDNNSIYVYINECSLIVPSILNRTLTEGSHYNMGLILAHQFLAQLDSTVKDTILGTIGSLICLRVSAEDAAYLAPELQPVIEAHDLVNLGIKEMIVKMNIEGQSAPPFSGNILL